MERLSIIPGGLSSASVYEDGAADMQSNLRRKGGALRPVLQAGNAADGQLRNREYSLLYECHFDDDKDIIGVYESNGNSTVYLIFRQEAGGEWQMYRNVLGGCNGKVTGIHQTGRILAVVTQDSLYYLIRKDGDYTWLGALPELPEVRLTSTVVKKYKQLSEYVGTTLSEEQITGILAEMKAGGYFNSLSDLHLIRFAFRLYDGSIAKPSSPVLVSLTTPAKNYVYPYWRPFIVQINGGGVSSSTGVDETGVAKEDFYRLNMEFDFDGLSEFKGIIRSVDMFLSPPLGVSNTDKLFEEYGRRGGGGFLDERGGPWGYRLSAPMYEYTRAAKDESLFYLVRSIPIGEEWKGTAYPTGNTIWGQSIDTEHQFPSTYDDYLALENLVMQEQLKEDSVSNHTYGAAVSYYYNGMLHLANINTGLFGKFASYVFSDYGKVEQSGQFDYIVEVELEVNGERKVVRDIYTFNNVKPMYLQSYLSYPDTRALRLNVYEVGTEEGGIRNVWNMVQSVALEEHPLLDLAYYLGNGLLPIALRPTISTIEAENVPTDPFAKVFVRDANKIKASATDNPLSFPAAHTYTAGNGTVLALQSNAMDVSARNFGTYPVYVFATDGIYLMQVGDGETAYSAITPLASTEYPTSGVVCVTPAGVAFVGSRGLCVVSAGGVQQLTSMVELPWPELKLEWDGRFPAGLLRPSAGKKSFNDYLKGISRLLYNPHENELVVSSDGETYDYVLQLGSGLLWENTEKAGVPVENHYPELWTLEVTNKAIKYIKDWSLYQEDSSREVAFLTRPMRLGTDDVKRLARMVVRGTLYGVSATEDGARPTVCLWMSNDGVHFKLLRGLFYKDLSRRDMDLGMLARSKGRYFVLGFCLSVTGETEIRMIEAEVEKQYNNLKMR